MVTKNKDELIMECTTLDELLDVEYGKPGTPEREQFDRETEAFCLAETLKEERLRAGKNFSDATRAVSHGTSHREERRGLSHSVAVQKFHAERPEEQVRLALKRAAAAKQSLDFSAEPLLYFSEHNQIAKPVKRRKKRERNDAVDFVDDACLERKMADKRKEAVVRPSPRRADFHRNIEKQK